MRNFPTLVLLLFLALTACDSDSDDTTTGGNTGTLTGRVELYDRDGLYESERQGVTVSVEGTSFSATTTADGKWTVNDLPPGIYTLTFEKPGYGHEKVFGFQFVGNGTAYLDVIDLAAEQVHTIEFLNLQLTRGSNNKLDLGIGGKASINSIASSIVLYASTDRTKLSGDFSEAELVIEAYSYFYPPNGQFSQGVTAADQEFFDTISPGSTVFSALRVLGIGDNLEKFSHYYDPIRNRRIYTSGGPVSNILEDTVP